MIDDENYDLSLIAERCSDILLSIMHIKNIEPILSALELLIYAGQKSYEKKTGKILKQENAKKTILNYCNMKGFKDSNEARSGISSSEAPLDVKICNAMGKYEDLIAESLSNLSKEELGSLINIKNKDNKEELIKKFKSDSQMLQSFLDLFAENIKEDFKVSCDDLKCLGSIQYEEIVKSVNDIVEKEEIINIDDLYNTAVKLNGITRKFGAMVKDTVLENVVPELKKEIKKISEEGEKILGINTINNEATYKIYITMVDSAYKQICNSSISLKKLIRSVSSIKGNLEFIKNIIDRENQNKTSKDTNKTVGINFTETNL